VKIDRGEALSPQTVISVLAFSSNRSASPDLFAPARLASAIAAPEQVFLSCAEQGVEIGKDAEEEPGVRPECGGIPFANPSMLSLVDSVGLAGDILALSRSTRSYSYVSIPSVRPSTPGASGRQHRAGPCRTISSELPHVTLTAVHMI